MSGKLKINDKKYKYKIPLLSEEIHSYLKNFLLHKKVNLPKVKSQITTQKLILEELETNWTKKFKKKTQFRIT